MSDSAIGRYVAKLRAALPGCDHYVVSIAVVILREACAATDEWRCRVPIVAALGREFAGANPILVCLCNQLRKRRSGLGSLYRAEGYCHGLTTAAPVGCPEITHIPGHNCHAMHERSCCDESITIGARIWHMKRCASLGHSGINH